MAALEQSAPGFCPYFDTDSRQTMFRAGKIHAKCFS